MVVPTYSQCIELMERTQMPPHIQRHSLLVARIALCLGRFLNRNHFNLDLHLLEAGGLLHDIAKARSLKTGEKHHTLGAGMVKAWGYAALAPIVEEHVRLEPGWLQKPITESLVVNYSDKRVKHDRIVPLQERFEDLMDRYGGKFAPRSYFQEKLELFLEVEKKIFQHLPLTPDELDRSCHCSDSQETAPVAPEQ